MLTLAKTPIPFNQVVSQTFKFYPRVFRPIIVYAIIYGLFASLPNVIPQLSPISPPITPDAPPTPNTFGFLYSVVLLFLTAFTYSAMLHKAASIMSGIPASHKQSLEVAQTKFVRVFLAMLIISIMVIAGIITFVLPGIFLGILLMFTVPSIVLENTKIMDAIAQSSRIVWGNWFRTFGVSFLAILFPMLATLSLASLLTAPGNAIVNFALILVLKVLYMPLIISCLLVQFNDLKLRRKAFE